MMEGFNIICISTSAWERPWGSRQQIMTRLAAKNKVLFVEFQLSFLHLLRYPYLFIRELNRRLRKKDSNLILYRPFPGLPFGNYNRGINLINSMMLLRQLRRLIKQYGFQRPILWIFDPCAHLLAGRLGEQLCIYHCIDSFRNEKQSSSRNSFISAAEASLCRKSGLVFVSAEEIFKEKARLNKDTYLMPSAANELFLDPAICEKVPEEIKDIPRPILGFAGTLDERIDLGLLDFLADKHPEWQIVFIGTLRSGKIARGLRRKRNIRLLGWKDNALLAGYIGSFDVCIIPYRVNDFTKSISPVKLYDYLSLGKPVVSTGLAELLPLESSGLVSIAKDKDEFCAQVSNCLASDNPDNRLKRLEFARSNTWGKRIQDISGIIAGKLS